MFVIVDGDDRPIGWTHDSNLADEMIRYIDGNAYEVPEVTACHVHFEGRLKVDGTIEVVEIKSLKELECCSVEDRQNHSSFPGAVVSISKAFTGSQAENLLREFRKGGL